MIAHKGKQIDPLMDMTPDLDMVSGDKGIGYWFASLHDLPKDFMEEFVKDKYFLDLGAGDGRVVMHALRHGAVKARGIEDDGAIINGSRYKRYLMKGDMTTCRVKGYDCIYYYLGSNDDLEQALIDNLVEQGFAGTFILYHRKVPHLVATFDDKMIDAGFLRVHEREHVIVYRTAQEAMS